MVLHKSINNIVVLHPATTASLPIFEVLIITGIGIIKLLCVSRGLSVQVQINI